MLTRKEIGELDAPERKELLKHYTQIKTQINDCKELADALKEIHVVKFLDEALTIVDDRLGDIRAVLKLNRS